MARLRRIAGEGAVLALVFGVGLVPGCKEQANNRADASGAGRHDGASPDGAAADGASSDAQPPDGSSGSSRDACVATDFLPTDATGKAAARVEIGADGRRWFLADWPDCTRPYHKDLKQREASYRRRWGEQWYGVDYRGHIISPGSWQWEEYLVIENGRRDYLQMREKSQVVVMAPLGGPVVDVYALTDHGFFHVDPTTKETTFVGGKDSGGLQDGLDDVAKLTPQRTFFGHWATADHVSGRVYFDQRLEDGTERIRYWEKLVPFAVDGEERLLPAIALVNGLYKELKSPKGAAIEPLSGGRPRFQLGTLKTSYGSLLRLRLWGSRILLSPDGKRTFVQPVANWPVKLDRVMTIDTWLDRSEGDVAAPAALPEGPTVDKHPAFSMRYDNYVYVARHTGSLGGPGLGFRFDPRAGTLQLLYDSTSVWDLSGFTKQPVDYLELKASESLPHDGPADAISLSLTTTCFQTQCPRTGAIINGGWDASGLRRYHDGFVTSMVAHGQMGMAGGRPEWNDDKVAAFGSLVSAPAIAPNGDFYLASTQEELVFSDPLRINGIRIIRLSRDDWPENQPVNGYASRAISPALRQQLSLEYAQRFVDALQ